MAAASSRWTLLGGVLLIACGGVWASGCECLGACSPETPPGTSGITTGTDLATLEKMVTFPRPPRAVRWRHKTMGDDFLGPSDWNLLAVLEYSKEDAEALIAGFRQARDSPTAFADEAWLSESTRASLKDAVAYDASPFFRSPLRDGMLIYLPDSSTFILYLFTM
jgi:hypothetical protein